MDRIKAALDQDVRQAVVIGAGFIGLELVENLVRRGISTTLVELQDQVLPPLDKEMTAPLVDALTAQGVTLLLRESAEGFEPSAAGVVVRLKSGQRLAAPVVVLGVGVRPENQLAVAAGLDVGPRGGIRVDDHLCTSDPDIYAVGDAIEVKDWVSGAPTQVPLAGPANRQGASPPTTSSAVTCVFAARKARRSSECSTASRRSREPRRKSCARASGPSGWSAFTRRSTPATIPAPSR